MAPAARQRLLRKLGFEVTGVDISQDMLRIARTTDPAGDYRYLPDDNFGELPAGTFDVALSAFTFDNIPGSRKAATFGDLAKLLAPNGTILSIVSSPEIYTHEWASFTTADFPENAAARSGDLVRIIVTDHQDRRPVEDILWTGESYRAVYREANRRVIQVFEPLAEGNEPYSWVSETTVAPWVIYVLRPALSFRDRHHILKAWKFTPKFMRSTPSACKRRAPISRTPTACFDRSATPGWR